MAEGGGGPDEDSGDIMLGATGKLDTCNSGLVVQHQPLNLKAAEDSDDRESSVGSPEPNITDNMGMDCTTANRANFQNQTSQLLLSAALQNRSGQIEQTSETNINNNISSMDSNKMVQAAAAAAVAAAHLNVTDMVTLQNLQNLTSLQQNLSPLLSGIPGLTNASNSTSSNNGLSTNAPLNLSVSASVSVSTNTNSSDTLTDIKNSLTNTLQSNLLNSNGTHSASPVMPQFILASGQLIHGIQGAQLLIPTSQGIATQTILTIPVNHVNSNDQIVNLALNNGQMMTTSLANLQAMAQTQNQPHSLHLPSSTNSSTSPINALTTTTTIPTNSNSNSAAAAAGLLGVAASLVAPHLLANGGSNLISALQQPQIISSPSQQPQSSPTPQNLSSHHRSTLLSSSNQTQSNHHHTPSLYKNEISSANNNKHNTTNGLSNSSSLSSSSSSSITAAALNSINRLAANNNELTITTTHGTSSGGNGNNGSAGATTGTPVSHPSIKLSPRSPCNTDTSTQDLLIDSPNQPTINQTNSNVVDGINLDEIKEFAKAFKLRRLSLGLTQTQVGQALSITEGPAYSQSAICSALATQMYCAAQLSSQQQAMFEKLDITPKSAQKIKPVLERWMKEAEERYKSGQNHLTDFIGVEPSKKRKRRTSFTPQALELLNAHFERNTHPSGTEITGLAHQLGYEREVIRIWFCNKRQALKNTVRMMSKGMV